MPNLREALAQAKSNRRKRQAGRGDRKFLGVTFDEIEDRAEEMLAGRVVDGLADDDAIRDVASEIGDWLDRITPWKGAKEAVADFLIDHVIEMLVRELLKEGRHIARKRLAKAGA